MNAKVLEQEIKVQCRFCNPPDKDRILYETDNFYVMLSLGPIIEGYLLINAKQHIDCCGAINSEIALEFDSIAAEIKRIYEIVYGGCIFYEHGRAGSCLQFSEASQHCYHAHMHCLPISLKLNKLIKVSNTAISVSSLDQFRITYKNRRDPYLFVDDGEKKIHYINTEIRKQYLRYIVSKEVGKPELWDWIKFQGIEKIKEAKLKLKPYFDSLNFSINHND